MEGPGDGRSQSGWSSFHPTALKVQKEKMSLSFLPNYFPFHLFKNSNNNTQDVLGSHNMSGSVLSNLHVSSNLICIPTL